MNWVVLPLDAMHTKPHFAPWDTWLTGLFVHMFGIGLSIALSAAKMEPRVLDARSSVNQQVLCKQSNGATDVNERRDRGYPCIRSIRQSVFQAV